MNQSLATTYSTRIVVFTIVLLCIYPSFLMTPAKQNILLLLLMGVSPIMLILFPKIMPRFDLPLIIMLVLMIVFPFAFHSQTMRWSTVLYTGMFICFFLSYVRILYLSDINIETFKKLLRWIIYAYAVVLIIQIACFYTGLPIFNKINIDITHGFPRLNSCGPEPEWTARMIVLIIFFYICLCDYIKGYKLSIKELFVENKKVCVSFLFVLIMCGSTTGLVLGGVLLARFVNLKSLFYVLFIILALLIIGEQAGISSFSRLAKFIPAILTLDQDTIMQADGSGASRIIPTLNAVKYISLGSFDGWVGHGVDFDQSILKLGGITTNGGALSLWINHGVIVQFLFWYFVFSICTIKGEWISAALCFLFITGGITLNLQVLWFMLVLFITFKYIVRNNESIYNNLNNINNE